MRRLLTICLLLLFASSINAATKIGVCGMPSTKTVQVRIYDITDTTEDVAWTSTGVTERANGQGKSCYYYTSTLDTGHAYQIDWKDNSTPVKTAAELIAENSISTVTVATNNDKTGYALTAAYDAAKTAAQAGDAMTLTAAYDAAKTAASQGSVNAIPTNPTLQTTWTDTKAGYVDAAISSRLASASYTAPDNAGIAAIQAKTDNLPGDPADQSLLDAQLISIQADLDNPNQYKADVSGLATDAHVLTIPINPLLTNDSRLNNLDASISSRSTLTAQQVWEYVTRTLTAGGGGATAQEVWEYATRELTGKTGFSLTSVYDPAKTCFQASSWIAPDNTNIGNVWTETQTHPTLAEIEASSVIAKDSTVAKQAELLRGLGLMMENHVEDDIVRNGQNLKTSSKFYLYDSKAHATTHDKVTGLIATYTVTVTYDNGYISLFKVVKD